MRVVCDGGEFAQDSAIAAGWFEDLRPRLVNPVGKESGHRRRRVVAPRTLSADAAVLPANVVMGQVSRELPTYLMTAPGRVG